MRDSCHLTAVNSILKRRNLAGDACIFTFASLYLEEPDGCIDGNAQRPARLLKLLEGELGESDPPPRPNLLVDATRISTKY